MQIKRKVNSVIEVLHCLKEIVECIRKLKKKTLLNVKAVIKRNDITNKENRNSNFK